MVVIQGHGQIRGVQGLGLGSCLEYGVMNGIQVWCQVLDCVQDQGVRGCSQGLRPKSLESCSEVPAWGQDVVYCGVWHPSCDLGWGQGGDPGSGSGPGWV